MIQGIYIKRNKAYQTDGTNYMLTIGVVKTPPPFETKRDREYRLALRWAAAVIFTALAFYALVLTDVEYPV